MSFETFRKKADEKWFKHRANMTSFVAQQERDRFYQLYSAYANKELVLATWALAIATIILSGLTLYFQYFR